MSDVAAWLSELGLTEYADAFAANDIDYDVLPSLTEEHLKELGVSLGHRVRLIGAISKLAAQQDIAATPHDPTLGQGSGTPAERRHLTIVFIDLVGSSALARRLDPEDMRDLLLSYQNAVAGSITRYGGYVAKFMGDGLLAYFGWPRAHGNDAERAVRAALASNAAVAALATPDGTTLTCRAGIATGTVVIGDLIGEGASREHAAVGETPNLAARFQTAARPGQILIGETTHALVARIFDLEDLGHRELKGFPKGTRAWTVRGERAAGTEADLPARPLIGRDEEFTLLRDAWQQSREGAGQVVLIGGEPGIGKSRLVHELMRQPDPEGCTRITLGCSPYHENTALFPMIQHLVRVLDWRPDDDDAAKLAKLERRLRGYRVGGGEGVALLAELLSLPSGQDTAPEQVPGRRRELMLGVLVDWLLEEAERRPVAMAVEDVHWADPTTLELLELVIERSRDARILTIATFRPSFAPPWPPRPHMRSLVLKPLGSAVVAELVGRQPGALQLPREVVDRIVSKADGVPLYAEELTRAVVGSAFPRGPSGGKDPDGVFPELGIPVTLQESLMARLDREPLGRQVAQVGAVIGREFSFELMNALGILPETDLRSGIASLVDADLIHEQGPEPGLRYVFRHALIQDAAYQSLLKRARRKIHRRIVDAVLAGLPDAADQHAEWIAHHCIQAEAWQHALDFLIRAGRQAGKRSSYAEAGQHLSRCLDVLVRLPETPERSRQELDVQMLRGSVLMHLSGEGAAEREAALLRARRLCEDLGETQKLLGVLVNLRRIYVVRGESPAAGSIQQELLERALVADDEGLYISAGTSLGIDMFYSGDFVKARAIFEDVAARRIAAPPLDSALEHGADDGLHSINWLSWTLWILGAPDEALRRSDQALEIARDHPHPYSRCMGLHWAAVLHQFTQNPKRVRELALELNALSSEQTIAQWLASSKILLGWAAAMDGDGDRGLDLLDQGFQAWCATGVETARPYWLGLMGEACAAHGLPDKGLAALERARRQTESTGEVWWEAELHRLTGVLLTQRGRRADLAAARRHFAHAARVARNQKAAALARRISMTVDALPAASE